MSPSNVTLLGALLAGLLSFVSPCVLPLTPVYIARLAGPALWEAGTLKGAARAAQRRVTTLHAVAFVAGFTTAFLALGATASVIGAFLNAHAILLRQIGGVLLVLFGLHVMGVLQIPGLNRERRMDLRPAGTSYGSSYLIGLVFALGWTPCIGPILASILLLAAQASTLSSGVLLLFVYSLGLGIPFLALGVAFDRVAPALKRLTPHLRTVEIVTGALLVLMGVVIFNNWLFLINSKLQLPGLG
jgi:cytochrome c-type biogenesis protein